jgi:DNA polymerase-3 subunit gamma/tau
MSTVALNLSRKWRAQDFDHIVGQDLAVRILKNSLYLGHYFPVYLCAGQRGCGKTSTARIFAAAINCYALPAFQKDPKNSPVPCLTCASCIAMKEGNHPDFIEIDAASHTGVDNIRAVIESSSLLPIMGRKRVYLIDEAHMLSKAAFNAALKILEEPPATALFILATTNPQKIIDTVRSRCFQLFFTPIAHDALKNHLRFVCKQEKIAHNDDALDIIVRHTEGSARDALNLLEQVRFSSSVVTKDSVLLLLGHTDDQHIMSLIQLTMQGKSQELICLLHSLNVDQHKAEFIWQRMVILLRALLWVKYGVRPHELLASVKLLESSAQWCTLDDLHRMIEALYTYEELFLKTATKHIFLEMMLASLCYKDKKKNDNGDGSAPCVLAAIAPEIEDNGDVETEDDQDDDEDEESDAISYDQQWSKFVTKVATLNDPLVYSVFKQARFIAYTVETHQLSIELSKDFVLFKEWLDSTHKLWQPLLKDLFSSQTVLDMQFTGTQKIELHKKVKNDETTVVATPTVQPAKNTSGVQKTVASKQTEHFRPSSRYNNQKVASFTKEARFDVSDETRWQKAALILRHFPGTITEIREKQ